MVGKVIWMPKALLDAERLDFGVPKAIRGYWCRQGDSQALAKSLGIQI